MSPAKPVMVHPSCVQTPSIAEKVVAFVREIRNTPAVDSTSTAPPTSASGDPAAVTSTVEPVNRPVNTPSFDPMPLGEVGDDGPSSQAANSVASVAQEAIWQASAQNRRRETGVFVSDIAVILVSAGSAARSENRQDQGHAANDANSRTRGRGPGSRITNWGRGRVIL